MEDNELFGETHEQEKYGLYGSKHAEFCGDLSHLQKQINDIKSKFDNPVVWFEVDGFYEAIGEDAIITDAVLDIGLTQRPDNGLELAGFKASMLDTYLPIMFNHGNRVALVNKILKD